MSAENNLIKKADLARAREIEFVELFGYSVKKLMEALGVTRVIPKTAGSVLKTYKAKGTLENGEVEEGEVIPLSHYKVEAVSYKEIILNKWRKATPAEAIIERGYDQAVEMTTDEMLKDVQKGIKKDFFDFLQEGTGSASGETFQKALAQAWGQLQVLFEDNDIEAVYFMNPLDVADYLGSAQISTQTAFGMSYVENFLGLGTVIFNSAVPKGTIYATARQNIVLYYIPTNGADLSNAFDFTTDTTGLIGIHEEADYTRMTAMDIVTSGLTLFAERLDGVVISTITDGNTLGSLTVTSVAGTTKGNTKVTVSPTKSGSNTYKYKVADTAQPVTYGKSVQLWKTWDGSTDITAETGKVITVVECDSAYKAVKAGSKAVVAKDTDD